MDSSDGVTVPRTINGVDVAAQSSDTQRSCRMPTRIMRALLAFSSRKCSLCGLAVGLQKNTSGNHVDILQIVEERRLQGI